MSVGLAIHVVRSICLASLLVAETPVHEPSLREAGPPFARLARPIRVELLHESCGYLLTRLDQVLSQSIYVAGRGDGQLRRSEPTHEGAHQPQSCSQGGHSARSGQNLRPPGVGSCRPRAC